MDKLTPGEHRTIQILNAIFLLNLIQYAETEEMANDMLQKAISQHQKATSGVYEVGDEEPVPAAPQPKRVVPIVSED